MKTIFLDNNATTPIRPEVLDAMMPYLKGDFANASSIYQLGQTARKAVENARSEVAAFIGAEDPSEIIFTSGGTEANNMAIKGVLREFQAKGRRIVSSAIEHSSIRNVLKDLAEGEFIDNVVVPVTKNGVVQLSEVEEAITSDTILVTIMAANNEIGTIQPVAEIAALCRRKGVTFHTDAIQVAGKAEINVKKWGVDMLSLSGHKFGAPKGVGILYIRKGTRMHSLLQGGRQENNRRAGTENVPGIVGIGQAAAIERKESRQEAEHLRKMRDEFENGVLSKVPHTSVNGDTTLRICNTTNICFDYTDSSELIMALDLKGVACSSGSACIAGSQDPSHVLLALGLPQHKAHASVRFSLGYSTTEDEIRQAIPLISDTVARLRENNPLWKEAANQ